jgi:hypothetical protein
VKDDGVLIQCKEYFQLKKILTNLHLSPFKCTARLEHETFQIEELSLLQQDHFFLGNTTKPLEFYIS